jgi:transglutaminase-like putative cysteine protease
MSILASLHHLTRYRYDRPVALAPQVIRLRPAPHCRTRIESYSLKVTPAQHFVNWQQDPNGNWLARFVFPEKTREFTITVDLIADMAVINPFDFFVEPFAETFPLAYPAEFAEELAPYLDAEPAGPRFAAFLASIPRERQTTVDVLVGLNQRLQREIRYLTRMESGVQTPEQTLAASAGSCRDSAWLQVQILRHLGLAARFVSGYLIQLRADARPMDRTRRNLRTSLRGRSSPARRDAAFPCRGSHQRLRRAFASHLLVRDDGGAYRGKAARQPSLLRGGMGGARCTG